MSVVGGFARVTKKRVGADWRIYVNGQPTNLIMSWDHGGKEWDLGTESGFIMSATTMGHIMRRLETLSRELPRGASLAVNP